MVFFRDAITNSNKVKSEIAIPRSLCRASAIAVFRLPRDPAFVEGGPEHYLSVQKDQ